ncbi:unnamed protein product [Rotaria socialis]
MATVSQFLALHKEFTDQIDLSYTRLSTIKDVVDIFLPSDKMKILNEFKTFEEVQLAVCGYNSSGKTSFLHHFLGKGNFLPAGKGAVTARVVKFSYAPAEEARLLVQGGGFHSPVTKKLFNLSPYFLSTNQMTTQQKRKNAKDLKDEIAGELARPKDYGPFSKEFAEWASDFIEIYIPSPVLELGITVYDTPGFHFGDDPILVENLKDLIRARRPSLIFLYDNETVSGDSKKCFDALKLSIQEIAAVGIFFLNTKADISTVLRDAGIDELPEQEEINVLLQKERVDRYSLLRNVSGMSSGLPDKLNDCDCFDIFSVEGPEHPMEQTMKKSAIDRIVTFAAKYNLQNTKQVSHIILNTITTFFDFVLVTNRRSKEEWEKLQQEAFRWADDFFEKYSSHLESIAEEAQVQLPIEFRKHRNDFIERAKEYAVHDEKPFREGLISQTVTDEIVKPTLNKIVEKTSSRIKTEITQHGRLPNKCSKNELIMAVYRDFLYTIGNIGDKTFDIVDILNYAVGIIFFPVGVVYLIAAAPIVAVWALSGFIARKLTKLKPSEELKILNKIEHQLIDVEHNLATCGDRIKKSVQKWLSENKKQFKQKVKNYFKLAMKTINHRKEAYILPRTFAGQFARIECRLKANLDLAIHHGVKPDINIGEEISRGGFFSIHHASWDTEEPLVAKIILDPIAHPDMAYMEAHFHRSVTDLNIEHVVPLRYLYEEENKKLFILLHRYPSSLHDYLRDHMAEVTIDKSIQIVLDITRVVVHMHSYELVHRDIKAQNILLDNNLQVFLADFGTCQHGTENSTVIGARPLAPELTVESNHDFTYQGSGADVYALGVLMYVVAPKPIYYPITQPIIQAHIDTLVNIPNSYITLMRRCLLTEAKSRPTAHVVVNELEMIADQIANSKPCLQCFDRPRYARCLPCRHKTLCNVCFNEMQRLATPEKPPKCVLCRRLIADTMEDSDSNTYMS